MAETRLIAVDDASALMLRMSLRGFTPITADEADRKASLLAALAHATADDPPAGAATDTLLDGSGDYHDDLQRHIGPGGRVVVEAHRHFAGGAQ